MSRSLVLLLGLLVAGCSAAPPQIRLLEVDASGGDVKLDLTFTNDLRFTLVSPVKGVSLMQDLLEPRRLGVLFPAGQGVSAGWNTYLLWDEDPAKGYTIRAGDQERHAGPTGELRLKADGTAEILVNGQ